MSLGSFLVGIAVGMVITSVGLERVIGILKETVTSAIPIFLGLV